MAQKNQTPSPAKPKKNQYKKTGAHTKFKNRKGPKSRAVLFHTKYVEELVMKGQTRTNTVKMLFSCAKQLEPKHLKSLLIQALPLMDAKTRKSILKKFWIETKPGLSAEDKRALVVGRRTIKLANEALASRKK